MAQHQDVDAVTGTATTGHEWDGIKELNTPLPRWWVWVFYATIVWSVGYWIVYPAWPTIAGYTAGLWNYSSRAEVAVDLAALQKVRGEKAIALANTALADIEKDPALLAFARAQGKAAFGENCAPCHGLGATGSKGFPNLNDDDWEYEGTLEGIHQTISFGIRADHAETRAGVAMPSFGKDGTLKRAEIVQVANYVRSLSGLPTRPDADLAAGKKIFAQTCTSCHGDDAKGKSDVGAPNLSDKIWLYGSDEATVVDTIVNGRGGVMPSWVGRLDPVTIKSLAVYVHTLGGGK
jgi:cytochrome c oxidase cbb3-type subunit III